jgi:tetratricopeptide (TPR) repeat protein
LNIQQEHQLALDRTLCNIGYSYWRLEQYELARKYYQWALDLSLTASNRNNELIACIYSNMATLFADEHNFDQALVYHDKALKIRKEYLPPTHKNIAMTYYSTGNILFRQGDFDGSLKALKHCLHIQLLSSPPDFDVIRQNELFTLGLCKGKKKNQRRL